MKQTAVEWLVKELESFGDPKSCKIKWEQLDLLFNQAKEMEKEQIVDAYEIGFADAWDDARYDDEPKYAGAEQYYKETFK
jgi:hypothetical protein